MRQRVQIDLQSTPYLPRGVRLRSDEVRGRVVLLAPERVLTLDPPGVAILSGLDGRSSVEELTRSLAKRFDAPAERIAADAIELLQRLADDGFVRA